MININIIFGCVALWLFNQSIIVFGTSIETPTATDKLVSKNNSMAENLSVYNTSTVMHKYRDNDGCNDDCPFNFAPVCVRNQDDTVQQFANECILKSTECTEKTS